MNWYKLTFRQIQPIHLGYKKHGVINETRIFITGQTMWGALTNAYFRETNNYKEDIFEKITCFYPMINEEVFEPTYQDGEFYLGRYSEKEFRQKFTTTLLSTAINPQSRNAKDESLHEIDVILAKKLYWVGWLKCQESDLEKIKEVYIGGDSRYGFGLISLDNYIEDNFSYQIKKGIYENEYPQNEPISNFVKFDKSKQFIGELEFLVEFDFFQKSLSPKLNNSGLYFNVGSIIK